MNNSYFNAPDKLSELRKEKEEQQKDLQNKIIGYKTHLEKLQEDLNICKSADFIKLRRKVIYEMFLLFDNFQDYN